MWIDGEMKSSQGFGTCKKQSTSFFAVKYIQVGGGVAPNGHSWQAGWTACWESDT